MCHTNPLTDLADRDILTMTKTCLGRGSRRSPTAIAGSITLIVQRKFFQGNYISEGRGDESKRFTKPQVRKYRAKESKRIRFGHRGQISWETDTTLRIKDAKIAAVGGIAGILLTLYSQPQPQPLGDLVVALGQSR